MPATGSCAAPSCAFPDRVPTVLPRAVRLFSHAVSGLLLDAATTTHPRVPDGLPPHGSPHEKPAKTRIYNNLKSFFQKQSRFRSHLHEFPGESAAVLTPPARQRHFVRDGKNPFPTDLSARVASHYTIGFSPRLPHGSPARHRPPRDA